LFVKLGTTFSSTLIPSCSYLAVGEALGLSLCECVFLDQQTLSLITTASSAELQHDCR
jgi:hypothetical protein